MQFNFIWSMIVLLLPMTLSANETQILFDGTTTDQWEFAKDAWFIDSDGSLTCRMQEVKGRNGTTRTRGMGYIWTRETYAGFEIQLLDNQGFQAAKGPKDPKNLNGALYDAQAASTQTGKPVGQWNSFKLTCRGPIVTVEINGIVVNKGNLDHWETAGKNPDGSSNKFKTALRELPRKGKIGFQNHGQVVWIKNVSIKPL